MPFYIRNSISAGPFRFTLSSSGIGLSLGIKGFRIGKGPRGHYIHAGRNGLYYRASIGGRTYQNKHPTPAWRPLVEPNCRSRLIEQGRVLMVGVESGDVLAMHDTSVADLIDDLNIQQARMPLGPVLSLSAAVITLLTMLVSDRVGSMAPALGIFVLLAAFLAWAVGEWLDQSLRRSVLFYNLDTAAAAKFEQATTAFDALAECEGRWHIPSGGVVRDLTTWKRNAGAAHLLHRTPAELGYGLPKVLRSNVTPPALKLGARTFYFFPEVVIVHDGRNFGAVGYGDLAIRSQVSRFIEDGYPPSDAQVVGHTWKHPNKSGGPDRRFKDNRQLPVCLYDVMHLLSGSGVNELAEFSKVGVVDSFAAALDGLPKKPASDSLLQIAPEKI